MDTQKRIDNFLYDGYKDFDIDRCNAGLTLMWIAGALVYIFGPEAWMCGIVFTVVNIITTVMASIIKKKYANLKLARYLFDVLLCSWLTLFMTTADYRFFVAYDKHNNWLLYVGLLILSVSAVFVFALLCYYVIVRRKEENKSVFKKVSTATVVFAMSGYFLAPYISSAMNSDTDSTGVACIGLMMSLGMALCDGVALSKLYLFLKQKSDN